MYLHDKYYIKLGRRKMGNLNTHVFKSDITRERIIRLLLNRIRLIMKYTCIIIIYKLSWVHNKHR